jgi:hypothetical protein
MEWVRSHRADVGQKHAFGRSGIFDHFMGFGEGGEHQQGLCSSTGWFDTEVSSYCSYEWRVLPYKELETK